VEVTEAAALVEVTEATELVGQADPPGGGGITPCDNRPVDRRRPPRTLDLVRLALEDPRGRAGRPIVYKLL